MSEFRYENRCVAFLDVLGFSELIEATTTNPTLVQTVGEIVTLPKQDLDAIRNLEGRQLVPSLEVSAFSDSIVLSTLSDQHEAFDLIQAISFTSFRLLSAGRLLRGGMVSGLAFHTSNTVFGPAVLSAHRLEHESAIYPRVVIEESLAEEVIADRRYSSASTAMPVLKRDRDGCTYLNPASFCSEGVFVDAREILRLIGKSTKHPRHRMKVKWAIDEWNTAFQIHSIPVLTDAEITFEDINPYEEIRDGKLMNLYSKLRPAPEK